MQLKNIDVEGLFTHFSSLFIDGNENKTATQNQLLKFENAISWCIAANCLPRIVHAANSYATLGMPKIHYDLVRPGSKIG